MAVRTFEAVVRSNKAIIAVLVSVVAITLIIVAAPESIRKLQGRFTRKPAVKNQPVGWKKIDSSKWGFSALLPTPIEHKKSSITTPFGEAPLETYASSRGPVRFNCGGSEI